jgi:hypothetical protein
VCVCVLGLERGERNKESNCTCCGWVSREGRDEIVNGEWASVGAVWMVTKGQRRKSLGEQ